MRFAVEYAAHVALQCYTHDDFCDTTQFWKREELLVRQLKQMGLCLTWIGFRENTSEQKMSAIGLGIAMADKRIISR